MTESADGTTTRHVEVEIKFDVLDSTPAPQFEALPIIKKVERQPVQILQAVYFDTPARDLIVHRITLRRRTGGHDAGWHLKRPADDNARTEIRAALADGPDTEVPAALREAVSPIVHDRPLEPIAWITNHRTVHVLHGRDGIPLAEFCDDHVTASTGPHGIEQRWREWEIELAEDMATRGDRGVELMKRLSAVTAEAGAVPAKHSSKLARALGLRP